MKSNITFLLLFVLVLLSNTAHSQKYVDNSEMIVIDTSIITIRYQLAMVEDTTLIEKVSMDLVQLEIGRSISRCHSIHLQQYDSTCCSWLERGKKSFPSSPKDDVFPVDVYKQNGGSGMFVIQRLPLPMGPIMEYSEEKSIFEWQLKQGKKNVAGYDCEKAECVLRGRRWTAWFTREIPFSEGPWKFVGLPGTILQIEDNNSHFSFTCICVKKEQIPILLQKEGIRIKSDRENTRVLEALYYDDMIAYIKRVQPEMKIQISRKDGSSYEAKTEQKAKPQPFNPIELE